MVRKEDISVTCVKKLFIGLRSLSNTNTFIQEINLTSAANVRKHLEPLLTETHMNAYMVKLNTFLVLFAIRKYKRMASPVTKQHMRENDTT